MSEFDDLLNLGLAETLTQAPVTFEVGGQEYTGIFGDLSESNALGDGGFDQEIIAQLIVPFTQNMPNPRHDAKVNVHFLKPSPHIVSHKIGRPIVKDEVSWILNLISAK